MTQWKPPRWMVRTSIQINEALGGEKGASICATLYMRKLVNPNRWNRFRVWFTDKLFWFDPQHCKRAFYAWGYGGRST